MSDENEAADEFVKQRQAAIERLVSIEMRHPGAMEGLAGLWVFARQMGILGIGLRWFLITAAIVFSSWYATKHWLVSWIVSLK